MMKSNGKEAPGGAASGAQNRGGTGFTLIELMIVLAVIAIITAVALPSFVESIQRGRRSDAQIALVEIAALQDKFRNNNMTYSTALGSLPYPAVSPEQYYQLAIIGTVTGTFFTARATPQGTQASDADCAVFTLTSTNVRNVVDSGGADNTESCWP